MNIFYSVILGIPILIFLIYAGIRLITLRKPKYIPRTIFDFNPATQEEKNQFFIEWCERNGISTDRRKTDMQLFDYTRDFRLPTFEDWKEIHGRERYGWVEPKLYNEWLKFIGAYDPHQDTEHSDAGDN